MTEKIQTYAEFWPHYLREHSHPTCRLMHYFGTSAAVSVLVLAAVSGKPALLLAALLCGYGPAWVGHFFIEKNRPATFTYPFWSFFSDFRMTFRFVTGRIEQDLRSAGVAV